MNKFERVVFHIGWDKTGSSTIQNFFHKNRESVIGDFSIFYPAGRWHAFLGSLMSSVPEEFVFNRHLGMADSSQILDRDQASLKDFEESICQVEKCKTLVVSYEGFVGLDESSLERIKEYLLRYGETVEVIAYVRPIFSYAKSAMSQNAKQGNPVLRRGYLPRNNYKITLEKFFEVFGKNNVFVRSFSPESLVGGDVLFDFMEFCGVSQSQFRSYYKNPTRENESLKMPAVVFSESLRASLASNEVHHSVQEYGAIVGSNLKFIAGPKISINSKLKDELVRSASDDVSFLRHNYNIEILDEPGPTHLGENYDIDNIVSSIAESVSYMAELGLESVRRGRASFSKFRGNFAIFPFSGAASISECFKIKARLRNESDNVWLINDSNPLRVSYRWDGDEITHPAGGERTKLDFDKILPGESKEVLIKVIAPPLPGDYILVVTMLEEGRCWLEEEGFNPSYMAFTIH